MKALRFIAPGTPNAEDIAADQWTRHGWCRLGLYDSVRRAAAEGFGLDDAGTVAALVAAVGRGAIHRRFLELLGACWGTDCVVVPDAADGADVAFLVSLGARAVDRV
jgi:hypothetical protein